MGYSVFLSHNSVDRHWVQWIASHAPPLGIDVYLIEHDPQPGVNLGTKIAQRIQGSDALVVFLTHNSKSSAWVHQEIGYARASGKPVIALVQPGLPQGVLGMLQGDEYISFDFDKPQAALSTLFNYLQNHKKTKERDRAMLMALGSLLLVAIFISSGGE